MVDLKTKQFINAGCSCVTDKGIWFVHYVMPILMFYDFDKKEVTVAKIIPCGERIQPYGLYLGIEFVNDKLFMFANNVKKSFVYYIETEKFKEIVFDDIGKNLSYKGTCLCGEHIYAIPEDGNVIIRININSEKIEYLVQNRRIPNLNMVSCNGDRIVGASLDINGIFKYEMGQKQYTVVNINEAECSLGSVVYVKDMYYGYDVKTNRIIKFSNEGKIEKKSICFNTPGALLTHTKCGLILLDDNYSGKVYVLNQNLELQDVICTEIETKQLVSAYLSGCWIQDKEKTYGISKSNELIIIENENVLRVDIFMKDELWNSISQEYISMIFEDSPGNMIQEDELCRLDVFIKNIN